MVVTSLSMSVRAHQKCLRLVPRSVFRLESALASVRSCGARNVFQCPEKTPRPEGVPNVYRQQKIFTSSSRAISVPGPSIRQIFSAACAPSQSLLGLLSALRLPQASPQRRFVSFFTSRLQTLRRIHFFDVRRRILFFTAPAAAARPTLINKKIFLCANPAASCGQYPQSFS